MHVHKLELAPEMLQEHLKGGSLHEYVKSEGPLDEHKAALALSRVLHGVRACRSRGLAHRDIKPGNFVFTHRPEASDDPRLAGLKLIDFGSSVECLETVRIKWMVGTLLYLSPEVCVGSLSPNSDMWATGVMVRRAGSGGWERKCG